MTLPLEGKPVVAVEQAVAAPLVTRSLADLEARVIKVERIDGGDLARGYDHVVHGTGAHFVWLNRGKESLAVDLKTEHGRSIVRSLIDRADVFLQNLAPGATDRLGFAADKLRSTRNGLIVVNMSGFGRGGPLEQRKAYDMLFQAEAGLISITGTPDTAVKTGIPSSDIAAGMYASQAVLAALLRRCRTGEGATIDVAMLDATVEWMDHALYTQMHTSVQPPRMGLSHSSIAPYGAYAASDGEVLIGCRTTAAGARWFASSSGRRSWPTMYGSTPTWRASATATNVTPSRLSHQTLVRGRARPFGGGRRTGRTGQARRPSSRPPTAASTRPLAHRGHPARTDRSLASTSHFR
jgi:crotonobetainyl-CoA:carnitine CoA-transferase CaiB-like acyl-CoA transferase